MSPAKSQAAAALVSDQVARSLPRERAFVVAVSGGLDSMVLLSAVCEAVPRELLRVATFDHNTGDFARLAVEHVRKEATEQGVEFATATAPSKERSEAAWRAARWGFLRGVSHEWSQRAGLPSLILTAHTADDQLETIVMRLLRGTGARGLSALEHAPDDILRPLLPIARVDVHAYADAHGVRWVTDPSNQDPRYLRNRVRRDLLPALLRVRPQLAVELPTASRSSHEIRRQLEALVSTWTRRSNAGLRIDREILELARPVRASAWGAVLGLHGIVVDRRGVARLADLDSTTSVSRSVQISGGIEVICERHSLLVRPLVQRLEEATAPIDREGATRFGNWVFESRIEQRDVDRAVVRVDDGNAWNAWFDADESLHVRAWQPGDRVGTGSGGFRRVKRYFADVAISSPERQGWPVVEASGQIVWIPGVRRIPAATVRPGRLARLIRCERLVR